MPPSLAPDTDDPPPRTALGAAELLGGKYHLADRCDRRGSVDWFVGLAEESGQRVPVRIGREPWTPPGSFRPWPSLSWECELRERAAHLGLPRILDRFESGRHSYVVVEDAPGVSLWDAWDDAATGVFEKFGWLVQLADLIRALHCAAAVLEELRPDQVRISPLGHVVLAASVNFLPLPSPIGPHIRPTLVSAPELHLGGPVDARVDLFHFGSVLYALELGRELSELDFEAPGEPKPLLERHPEMNPCVGRLLAKTFVFDRTARFPSEEHSDDLTGFGELIWTLERARRVLARAHLDIAAWSTTGMVRSSNEDAALVVHAAELRESATDDWAIIALADGMGGSAAGEVAAAMAIQTVRQSLLTSPPLDKTCSRGPLPGPNSKQEMTSRITEALQEANRAVYLAGRCEGRHGMGCTIEAVFVDGEQIVVGHVGDSRTYLFSKGQLHQLTRDQSFLNYLLEKGQLTPDEARAHPRRGELSQAIGGRADVEPEIVTSPLRPGDWLVVCSDGLSGRLSADTISDALERANSADSAARRLINRANLEGAGDNVTVVVARAC